MVKGWIDPKTASKAIFMSGDISENSKNDMMMKHIVGDDWKLLTGAGMPVTKQGYSEKHGKQIASSPGYDHATYWPTVLDRDARYLSLISKHPQSLQPSAAGDSNNSSVGSNFKITHNTLAQSNKYNKLIVGKRRMLEYHGEKWNKMRLYSGVPDDFLESFDWDTLKKESPTDSEGRTHSMPYIGYSSNNKYVIRELSSELHTWLLCSSLSYIDHMIPNNAIHKQEDIKSMEDDSLLFRIYAHFKDEVSNKIFVALVNDRQGGGHVTELKVRI